MKTGFPLHIVSFPPLSPFPLLSFFPLLQPLPTLDKQSPRFFFFNFLFSLMRRLDAALSLSPLPTLSPLPGLTPETEGVIAQYSSSSSSSLPPSLVSSGHGGAYAVSPQGEGVKGEEEVESEGTETELLVDETLQIRLEANLRIKQIFPAILNNYIGHVVTKVDSVPVYSRRDVLREVYGKPRVQLTLQMDRRSSNGAVIPP